MSTNSTNTNATVKNPTAAMKAPFTNFNFNEECLENARKQIDGILAPDVSFMPPPEISGAISNLNDESKDL
jgi:hypothetical protein